MNKIKKMSLSFLFLFFTVLMVVSTGAAERKNTDYEKVFHEAAYAKVQLERPVLKSVTAVSWNSIKITWDSVANAEKYEVMRKEAGVYVVIGTTKETSFIQKDSAQHPVEPGITYRYTVRAVNTFDGVVSRGKAAYPTMTGKTLLKKVPSFRGTAVSDTQIELTWKAVEGADQYRIYRKNSKGAWRLLVIADGKNLSYRHQSTSNYPVEGNHIYEYTIRAYKNTSKGYIGGEKLTGIQITTPAKAPVWSSAYALSDEIHLKWEAQKGVEGYRIRRYQSGKWKTVAYTKTNSYTETSKKVYLYSIRSYKTVNGKKVYSGNSTIRPKNIKKMVFIGHSRGVGLGESVKAKVPTVWQCKISMGYSWMVNTGFPAVEDAFDQNTAVVIMMGVNDLYNKANYADYLNRNIANWTGKGAEVYFVEEGPITYDPYASNAEIRSFNTYLKEHVKGIKFIDANSYLNETGFTTWDGLHYKDETNIRLYRYILNSL